MGKSSEQRCQRTRNTKLTPGSSIVVSWILPKDRQHKKNEISEEIQIGYFKKTDTKISSVLLNFKGKPTVSFPPCNKIIVLS
uniref:Uncharacterized protein n=1 Tax=Megaselia scalaris TaxID=36166 RepID=T1GPX5_MEGSC